MQITIREVAKKANVSIGTVSRVLNHEPNVGKDNVERVLQAVRTLDYRPLRARTVADRDKDANTLFNKDVAILLLGMDRTLATLPVVAAAIHGVEAALTEAGANVVLANVPAIDRVPTVLQRDRVDAVIAKGALQGNLFEQGHPQLWQKLAEIPCVWCLGRPTGITGDAIGVNDLAVGELAAQHLVEKGHRDLAFLNPKSDHVLFRVRKLGFISTAEALGATVRCIENLAGEWNLPLRAVDTGASLDRLVDKLLALQPRPTGIFVPSDSISAKVYSAFAKRGIRVGTDVHLISCNNEIGLADRLFPALTTVDIHAEQIGRRSVELLTWRMNQATDSPTATVQVEPTLVTGESVTQLEQK